MSRIGKGKGCDGVKTWCVDQGQDATRSPKGEVTTYNTEQAGTTRAINLHSSKVPGRILRWSGLATQDLAKIDHGGLTDGVGAALSRRRSELTRGETLLISLTVVYYKGEEKEE